MGTRVFTTKEKWNVINQSCNHTKVTKAPEPSKREGGWPKKYQQTLDLIATLATYESMGEMQTN